MKPQILFFLFAFMLTMGAIQPAWAGGTNSWNSASDLLAVGLPALAAGMTWKQEDSEGAQQLAYSLGLTFVAASVLKNSIHAARPDGSDNKSFPSGHTALAFAGVRYIDKRYGAELSPFTPWLYAAAGLTGIARVQANMHHWQDVFAGGALGYVTASYLAEPLKGGQLSLLRTPGGFGVGWQRTF
jgi:membrane-associated phospholipid phosphatase